MANMRVHELAKELNISSKAITDMLSNADKKYTAMSGLGESEINSVKSKFTKAAGNTANKSGPKKAEEKQVKSEENKNIKAQDKTGNKSEQNTQDTKAANTSKDVDKKHISQVYFPQNSQKTDSRDRNNNRDNNQNRNNRDGYRNDRNNGGYRNDRNNDRNGGYQNRDNNGQNRDGYRNDRNNGGYRNDRNNDRNGGYQNRDNNGQNRDGYRNDRNNGGYRNDRNNDRNGGYQNRDNNGQNGGRSGRDGQGFSGQRRNDRGSSAPKDDFIFETKPDSRRPDSRKNDSRKNDRKKDNEAKENLKFANSKLEKKPTPKQEKKEEETIKQLILPDSLTIKELADKMKVQPSAIVKKLFLQGKVVTINQEVDYDTAEEIALEFNCICDHEVKVDVIDTPGHEAFTAMRMRGAQATDIAILVVAADDGVMPQTIEAINHAKAAGVEIIVAVNKIDKPNANIEKVKQELTEYELIAEDWGGSTTFVPVSAHTKEGIDELLEMILLTAEVNELKANPNRKARGIVIEAELDKGRGPVATILVQKGTLRVGDAVAAGSCYGKIRAMIDDTGRRVKEATPSMPVEILGLNDVPNAGEIIMATESEKEARNIADTFIAEGKKKLLDDTKHKVSLDALFEQIQAGNMKELDLIIKADVQGSVEAVKQSLVKLSNEEVIVKVIHGGVGNINESDVVLASASNAIIIGFNVKPDNQARIVAEREKVDLRLYSVIYNAIEDVEAALKGMLEPIYEEKIIGHAEIRQIFKASGVGNIAGAIVTEGRITKDSIVRITRDKEQIYEGPIATLKHFKDDVKEVKGGSECGMVFENFGQIQEGDLVEAHIMVEVPR